MNEVQVLLVRSQEGDAAALQQLMEICRKKIYALAYSLAGNQADAEDLTQETILRVYTLLPSFDASKPGFDAWVHRMTVNLWINWSKRRQRFQGLSLDALRAPGEDGEAEWELPDERHLPEEEIEKKELRETTWRLMGELPPKSQGAVVLREIEGYSYKEIASVLECSETAVKTRINRGRETLKQKLVEAGYRPQVMRPKPKGE